MAESSGAGGVRTSAATRQCESLGLGCGKQYQYSCTVPGRADGPYKKAARAQAQRGPTALVTFYMVDRLSCAEPQMEMCTKRRIVYNI